MSEERTAWGWGLASVDAAGTTLDVWYPELNLGEAPAEADRPNHNFGTLAHDEADARGIRRVPVFVVSQLDEPISNAADAYLKLHLMSMRMAKPNTLNLDGIFAQLANVVWTNYGPFAVEDFTLRKADVERASTEAALAFASQAGLPAAAPAATVNVFGVDKFPRMIDYVVPTGVRLGDADWLDGAFTAADLLMVSVLQRLKSSTLLDAHPTLPAYLTRAESRPAFQRAFAAQLAVFTAQNPTTKA